MSEEKTEIEETKNEQEEETERKRYSIRTFI